MDLQRTCCAKRTFYCFVGVAGGPRRSDASRCCCSLGCQIGRARSRRLRGLNFVGSVLGL